MEQIIFYLWLFVGVVVSLVDTLRDWLAAHGISTGIVTLGIIGGFLVGVYDKWLIETDKRLHAIELKLGIEYTPSVVKKNTLTPLLIWFFVAIYLLGKSLGSGRLIAIGGILLACLMLFICACYTYYLIDQRIRNSLRKKREWEED